MYCKYLFSLAVILTGCSGQNMTLENQVQHKQEYEVVFFNSVRHISILYKTEEGHYKSQSIETTNEIEFIITDEDSKYITWNTYTNIGNDSKFDLKIYVSNINDVEAGERDLGKFGKEKLHKIE